MMTEADKQEMEDLKIICSNIIGYSNFDVNMAHHDVDLLLDRIAKLTSKRYEFAAVTMTINWNGDAVSK